MLNTQKHTTLFSLGLQPGIKPVFFIFLIFFQVFCLKAQENLVPNGSFEEYSQCPTSNELNNGQFERANGWWIPTESSPDFFNSCNSGFVSVPNNFWGHQESFHGNGYVGFIPVMYDNFFLYEYFRTALKTTLKPCVEYQFKMYVSLADFSTHGLSKIGAYFSTDDVFQQNSNRIAKIPQVKQMDFPIIDTVNWTKIEGTFIAEGGEKYLTIGFFEDSIDSIFVQNSSGFYFQPYYYVDSVSLFEVGLNNSDICDFHINLPNVFTPNDDGKNDFIDITDYLDYTSEVVILNRWGNVVTILNNQNLIWDGKDSPESVYYFYFDYTIGNFKKRKTGYIHLIR